MRLAALATGVALIVSGCSAEQLIEIPEAPETQTTAPDSTNTQLTDPPPTTTTPTTTLPDPTLSPTAEAYLAEAIDAVSTLSINRDRIDWDATRDRIFRSVDGAQTTQDVYPAVHLLLVMVADDHSVFLTPDEAAHFTTDQSDFAEPIVEILEHGIGYVSIGYYRGDIGPKADDFAAALASSIDSIYGQACGWILDLRANGGGNMWPMLAGLAPLLTPGEVGRFTYPDGRTETWELVDGESRWRGETMTVSGVEADGSKPVAVLVGRRTASSGEAVTTAFLHQPGTRLFGQPTAGLTTSNEPVEMSDGAMIILTQSVFTDRTGQAFGQGIRIEPHRLTSGDETQEAALGWLADQCAGS